MKWSTVWLSALFLAVVACSAAADTTYVEIGSASGGHIVYFGTDLNPTMIAIDLGTGSVGTDTTWSLWLRCSGDPNVDRLGLARLPFYPPKAEPDTTLSALDQQKRALQSDVGVQLIARRAQLSRVRLQTATDDMTYRLQLLSASPLVDSVRSESDQIWYVKWVGQKDWERNEIIISQEPVDHQASLRNDAELVLGALRNGQLVIIDRGYLNCSATNVQRQQLEQDLASVKVGVRPQRYLPTRVVKHLQQPIDLKTIITSGEER